MSEKIVEVRAREAFESATIFRLMSPESASLERAAANQSLGKTLEFCMEIYCLASGLRFYISYVTP